MIKRSLPTWDTYTSREYNSNIKYIALCKKYCIIKKMNNTENYCYSSLNEKKLLQTGKTRQPLRG